MSIEYGYQLDRKTFAVEVLGNKVLKFSGTAKFDNDAINVNLISTPVQLSVLEFRRQGLTNEEISALVGISTQDIEKAIDDVLSLNEANGDKDEWVQWLAYRAAALDLVAPIALFGTDYIAHAYGPGSVLTSQIHEPNPGLDR